MSSENQAVYETNALYEKEVQDYLAQNLNLLGAPKLKLIAVEHPVKFGRDVGRIDILAMDADGFHVVIEVKRGTAGRGAIGQIQSYMGAISDANPGEKVRGILVSLGIDDAAASALRVTQNIGLYKFKTHFEFAKDASATVSSATSTSTPAVRPDYWEKLGGTILTDSMQCKKCGHLSKVVLIGHQRVCGMCGHPK